MAEQNLIDRLDAAIDAILAGRREGLAAAEPELAAMLVIAGDLRDLPDPDFKARLKAELVPPAVEVPMSAVQTVIPYLVVDGAAELIRFVKDAFGADERFKVHRPDGTVMHAEMSIGDSKVELADIREGMHPFPGAIHLYVPDVDALYERALRAGATSIGPLTDQPYGDREGSVKDAFGNHWYIATHQENVSEEELMLRFAGKGTKPRRDPSVAPLPEGFGAVTPYLHVAGAERQIDFLSRAFGATEVERTPGPEGRIMHATFRVGDSLVELSEAHGQWGPMPMHFHLYVDDADAVYARALRAGGTSIFAPAAMPYGEYMGGVRDAASNEWYIATRSS